MTPNWPTNLDLIHNEQQTLQEVGNKVDAAIRGLELSDYKRQRNIINLDWHQLDTLRRAVCAYRDHLAKTEKEAKP